MEKLSFELFKNEQLLTILLGMTFCAIVLFSFYYILKKKQLKEFFMILFITLSFALTTFINLGSSKLPTTTFQPTQVDEYIIFELEDENTRFNELYAISGLGDTNANPNGHQIWFRDIQIVGSNDLNTWVHLTILEEDEFYKWTKASYNDWNFRYIKVIFPNKQGVLTELGIKRSEDSTFIPLKVIQYSNPENPYPFEWMIDENDLIVTDATFYDQTYFDEIYHVRNAYEINQEQYLYAHVHPLLGTRLMSIGIDMFGMNPFGFRFMGALFSVLALPLFYLILKALFNKPLLSIIGTTLFAVDFMHLTTGRIGTLEPFSIFFILAMYYFMLLYTKLDFFNPKLKMSWIYLGLSGLFMGFAWATKWTGLYASCGLALIFFIHLGNHYQLARKDPLLKKVFFYKLWRILAYCLLVFVLVPVAIYFINYIGLLVERAPYQNFSELINGVITYTQGIFKYHANLEATHPFESIWLHWLFDIRPVWYYFKSVEDGIYTISCFNNPLISWAGLIAVIYTIYAMVKHRTKEATFIALGYLSSLLPWVFIGRCLFSYHYYPSYPFLILALIYAFRDLLNKDVRYKKIIIGFTIVSFVLFLAFLPVIAGHKTDINYVNTLLRWFESWYFGH